MPALKYSNLTAIARGYADAIIETAGCSDLPDKWNGIGVDHFAPATLRAIEKDCEEFLNAAVREHPDGEDAFFEEIDEYDLGRDFYMARQGTGTGFDDVVPGELAPRLYLIALNFDFAEIDVSDERIILIPVFLPRPRDR